MATLIPYLNLNPLKKIADREDVDYFYSENDLILTISWKRKNATFHVLNKAKELQQVDKDYFFSKIVGPHYLKIERQLPSLIENYQITKDKNGTVFLCKHDTGIIYGFDTTAKKILEWDCNEIGQGHAIYAINYQAPDFLWLTFPTGHTVTKVSISAQKEVYRIGEYAWEDKAELLSYPESLFIKENLVFIPNMGNNKLFKFNCDTAKIELIQTFNERLWQYAETELGTVILTDKAMYSVEQ